MSHLQSANSRVLARNLARTLTDEELELVAGGGVKGGTMSTTCNQYGCYRTQDDVGVEYDW